MMLVNLKWLVKARLELIMDGYQLSIHVILLQNNRNLERSQEMMMVENLNKMTLI